jgi:CRP-like cAMP-binding protein
MHQRIGSLERKLSSFIQLTAAEKSCLNELQQSSIPVKSGQELTRQGESGHVAYILQKGWGCSYKLLLDGSRQVIAFPIPGDCVGLRSILLRTSDHSFTAITDAEVSRIEVAPMLEIFNQFPHLGAAILWATSRDEAITVEHLASIGRRTALERTAHFFLELSDRLQLVGLGTDTEYDCPLSQYALADALGLSSIHVNRVLRELREIKLLTFQDRRVTIHDRPELIALAGYEVVEQNPVLVRNVC